WTSQSKSGSVDVSHSRANSAQAGSSTETKAEWLWSSRSRTFTLSWPDWVTQRVKPATRQLCRKAPSSRRGHASCGCGGAAGAGLLDGLGHLRHLPLGPLDPVAEEKLHRGRRAVVRVVAQGVGGAKRPPDEGLRPATAFQAGLAEVRLSRHRKPPVG